MNNETLLPRAEMPTTQTAMDVSNDENSITPVNYPMTKRIEVVEEHFGHTVIDAYRWLENDAREDDDVAAWVKAQNKLTHAHLDTLPGRDIFNARLRELINYEKFTVPVKKGSRYFYQRNSGVQNQLVLYVREGVDGAGRVVIDPNDWSEGGTTALAEWSASGDGRHVAYAVQESGSDWRTIRVLDVDTGTVLGDEVKWARFTTIEWAKDGSGFFYARFPEPAQGAPPHAGVENHAVYFHAIATPQSKDRLVYATPNQPAMVHSFSITQDGHYLAIYSTAGSTLGNTLTVIDLASADWKPRELFKKLDCLWGVIGNVGTKLFLTTTQDAPRLKVVTLDIAAADSVVTDLIAQQAGVLSGASLVGGRLLVSHMVDVQTQVMRYTLDGKADGLVQLPGIGTAMGFDGSMDDDEAFYGFTSFNSPGTIYRYNVASNMSHVWAKATVPFDLNRITVEQRFYNSKDGTRIPMFVVRRKDACDPASTLLYAYGGYGLSQPPAFSPLLLAWIEQGGVFALANIRGGGEFGRAWHEAGRREHKQNVFNDFIAAGEYLKAQGITSPGGLAIQGASNGGLLIGAVVNQRPDLFAAAIAQVGVMDMLRFDKFTAGKLWVDEYGDPANEADFNVLKKYSPLHNIQPGKSYPAIIATTADTDDRVVPGHTFKYAAALQTADIGPKPHLVRIETRAGHGGGKPIDKVIAETADLWAFAAHWTGLDVQAVK